jgi:hypothetical protein
MPISIEGAWDIHCHPAPCLFPRLVTDRSLAKIAREYKMEGFMIKSHHEPSMSRAALVSEENDNLQIFGGLVLNTFIGGLNPIAADMAMRQGGKALWFATCDSKRHVELHGAPGRYSKAQEGTGKFHHEGLSVTGDNGKLLDQAVSIIEIAKEYDAFLGSGHCTMEECVVLAKKCKEMNFKKFLIQHAHYKVPNVDIETQKELVKMGATIELGYCTISPAWAANTLEQAVKAIKEVGAEHFVLVSDGGQLNNPSPPECLRVFSQAVSERGVSEDEVMKMIVDKPRWLLGLDK